MALAHRLSIPYSLVVVALHWYGRSTARGTSQPRSVVRLGTSHDLFIQAHLGSEVQSERPQCKDWFISPLQKAPLPLGRTLERALPLRRRQGVTMVLSQFLFEAL